jgi:hypothetical protein
MASSSLFDIYVKNKLATSLSSYTVAVPSPEVGGWAAGKNE